MVLSLLEREMPISIETDDNPVLSAAEAYNAKLQTPSSIHSDRNVNASTVSK